MTKERLIFEFCSLVKVYVWELEQEAKTKDWIGASEASSRIWELASELNEAILDDNVPEDSPIA